MQAICRGDLDRMMNFSSRKGIRHHENTTGARPSSDVRKAFDRCCAGNICPLRKASVLSNDPPHLVPELRLRVQHRPDSDRILVGPDHHESPEVATECPLRTEPQPKHPTRSHHSNNAESRTTNGCRVASVPVAPEQLERHCASGCSKYDPGQFLSTATRETRDLYSMTTCIAASVTRVAATAAPQPRYAEVGMLIVLHSNQVPPVATASTMNRRERSPLLLVPATSGS